MSGEMANEVKLISGRSHPELSEKVAKRYACLPALDYSALSNKSDIAHCAVVQQQSLTRLVFVCRRLGIEVARTISLNYSNQETSFTVGESVRDEDVFIIQSTATGDVNEGLMELLIAISACRTASARRITAVM